LLGAGVTAFYMTRLVLMTFAGERRWERGVHPHESPLVMTLPLIVLAIASVGGGLVLNNWINGWLEPATGGAPAEAEAPNLLHFSLIGITTLIVVALGVAISLVVFGPRKDIPTTQPASRSPFTLIGRNDLFGDSINEAVFMRPGEQLTARLTRLDNSGIDGTVNGTAAVIGGLSSRLRRAQNGFVRTYALTMLAGAAVVGAVLVLGRLG
jgi:NADH-quinone oxidoreductase subunit L